MKKLIVLPLLLLSTLTFAKEYTTMKTSCIQQSEHAGKTLDQQKEVLINQAKQLALTDLYGEMIFSKTDVSNGKLVSDDIRSRAIGAVRLKGNPSFYNGKNFGEVCTDVTAYVTDKDIEKFSPKNVSLEKYCFNDPSVAMKDIKTQAKYGAYKEIISQYKPSLKVSGEQAEKLIHGFKISNDNFDFDTASYCFNAVATILPYELEMGTDKKSESKDKVSKTKKVEEDALDNTIYGKWYGTYTWSSNSEDFLPLEIEIKKDDTFKITWKRNGSQKEWDRESVYHVGSVLNNKRKLLLQPDHKKPYGGGSGWTNSSLQLVFDEDELILEGKADNKDNTRARFVKVAKFPMEYTIKNPNDEINGKWYGWYLCSSKAYYISININNDNIQSVTSNGKNILKSESHSYTLYKSKRKVKFDGEKRKIGYWDMGNYKNDWTIDNLSGIIDGNTIEGTTTCGTGSSNKFLLTKVSQLPKDF